MREKFPRKSSTVRGFVKETLFGFFGFLSRKDFWFNMGDTKIMSACCIAEAVVKLNHLLREWSKFGKYVGMK